MAVGRTRAVALSPTRTSAADMKIPLLPSLRPGNANGYPQGSTPPENIGLAIVL